MSVLPQREPDSLTMSGAVRAMIRSELARLHVGLVATVVVYDATTQTVDCQPVVRGRDDDGSMLGLPVPYPPLLGVPVRFPSGAGFSFTWPLIAGDFVWIDFGERSLDEWEEFGLADVTPQSLRRFDIADAVAYPGIRPPGAPLSSVANGAVSATELILGRQVASPTPPGGVQIRINLTTGKISIGNGTTELLTLLDSLIAALQSATVQTILGPQPFMAATQATLLAIKNALATIKA